MNWWRSVLLAGLALGGLPPAFADPIKANSPPPAAAPAEAGPRTSGRNGARPLADGEWNVLDPEFAPRTPNVPPARKSPRGLSRVLPFAALVGGILVVALLIARSMRRWGPSEAARYLERTGAPWGRREDLFVEKLTLELRLHRAAELTKALALEQRFEELDKVERPLRKMRARFRSVRREYRHIATRIGPVSDAVRSECAQSIRRCGLVQAPVLSLQEREAMRRLSLALERRKRAM